jgi:MFS family permease
LVRRETSPDPLSNFLKDRSIVATAIPHISNDFRSLNGIGWYGSAYTLTSCAFQLFFGRIYTFYSSIWVFLAAIVLFEIESALCGAAPNLIAFIVGRAIAGIGSAGVFTSVIIIVTQTIPLARRGAYSG